MPRPKEIARAQKLQKRPTSVGWNPFNSTLSQSPKRQRQRNGSHTTTVGANNSLMPATSNTSNNNTSNNNNNQGDGHDQDSHHQSAVHNFPLSNSTLADTHGLNDNKQKMTDSQSAPYLAATHLSHLPDDQVWDNLSTMSLRDLAAGHHCVPLPPKVVHPSLDKHLRVVDRLESYDKQRRMMNTLERREATRWRLASRKKERIAMQSYCSQPLLHIPDPNVQLHVSEPMSVGQVLRSKYHKTHPPPSYNVKVYRNLKKHADLRALKMILRRFDSSEKHDDHIATVKDYTRSLSRGNLRVSAMKRTELETRLGTPFALSGTSIYSKPGVGSRRSMRSSTAGSRLRRGKRGGSGGGGGGGGSSSSGRSSFGLGAFDTPAGVAKPGEMLSMQAISPETEMQGTTATAASSENIHHHHYGENTMNSTMSAASNTAAIPGGSAILPKPIWQRDPHEHWKPPSHYLRTLERTAMAKKKKYMRTRGFPNKYLYPIEVSGLDTLFPE